MATHKRSRSVRRRPRKSISELFAEGTPIDDALRAAARDARALHKRMGQPIVVWQNGRVVEIPPEEIVVDVPADAQRPKRRRVK